MSGIILGYKQSQSRFFNEAGDSVPSTSISTDSCYLLNIFSKPVNGYSGVQLGFGTKKRSKKSVQGQVKKAGLSHNVKYIKEIRIEDLKGATIKFENNVKTVVIGQVEYKVGDQLRVEDLFKVGDYVSVCGTSQGKGFAGVVRRYNFRGGPKTHGQSDRHRARGSLGSGTTPGRVFKGLRMAGRMGSDRVTVKNLKVLAVSENNLIIKGLVPGKKGGVIEIVSINN